MEEHHKEEPEEADVPEGLAVAVLRTAKGWIQIRSLLEVFTWLLEVYSSLGSDISPDMWCYVSKSGPGLDQSPWCRSATC